MYEHLSSRVDHVIQLANKIAREYELDYVGTEHVLLAISQEATGLGSQILLNHGITNQKLKAEVHKIMQASLEDTWVFGRLPGSPHFRNVMALAIEEARKLKSKSVCTEHVLLALLVEKGCVAQKALKSFGLTPKQIREEIRQLQAENSEQVEPA